MGKTRSSCDLIAILLETASVPVGTITAVVVVLGETIAFVERTRYEAVPDDCDTISFEVPEAAESDRVKLAEVGGGDCEVRV